METAAHPAPEFASIRVHSRLSNKPSTANERQLTRINTRMAKRLLPGHQVFVLLSVQFVAGREYLPTAAVQTN